MKAYVLHGIGDLRYETVDDPVSKKGEVIVKVKAAGICGSDIPRIYQTGAYSYPLIPGHEFSGVVAEVGNGVDAVWKGRRVGIFPLIPCRSCQPCLEKKYEMCRKYDYLGSRSNGGFAEYVSVPVDNLIELPNNVSFETAAMLEPMTVVVHAMRKTMPMTKQHGQAVVICGLGTIGMLLLMFLKAQGYDNILAIGNREYQIQQAYHAGVSTENICNSSRQDALRWIMERTDGKGADTFFECVGKNETVSLAVDSVAPAGKVMLVGNPHSDMKLGKNEYWKILRNQLTVMGTWNSSFTHEEHDDWHYALHMLEKGLVSPETLISHRMPFRALEEGLQIMRDKSEAYIKIMGVL